jgi:DNA polymerase-3 subunit beta
VNFTTDRTNFLAAAEAAARNIDPKAPNDLLKTTLVRATTRGLEVSGGDMTFAVQTRVPAMVLAPGEICLPADDLKDALAALPKGEVGFELRLATTPANTSVSVDLKAPVVPESLRAFLKAGRRTVQLPTRGAEGYPPFAPDPAAWLSLPSATLMTLLRFAKQASLTDSTRPHMCGVKLGNHDNAITAAGTDGHRAAMTEAQLDAPTSIDVLVPNKAVAEILRVLVAHPEAATTEIAHDASSMIARIGDTTLFARLTEGKFPVMQGIIPQTHERVVRVARAAMLEVLRAMSRVNSKDSAGVKLECAKSVIQITTVSDSSSGEDSVDCEMEGPALTIGFNGSYLADAFDSLAGAEVFMEFGKDALDPGLCGRSTAGGHGRADADEGLMGTRESAPAIWIATLENGQEEAVAQMERRRTYSIAAPPPQIVEWRRAGEPRRADLVAALEAAVPVIESDIAAKAWASARTQEAGIDPFPAIAKARAALALALAALGRS